MPAHRRSVETRLTTAAVVVFLLCAAALAAWSREIAPQRLHHIDGAGILAGLPAVILVSLMCLYLPLRASES